MSSLDDGAWATKPDADLIDDDRVCTISADFLERWIPVPSTAPHDEEGWARQVLATAAPSSHVVESQVRYLIDVGRWVRERTLPATDLISAFLPDSEGPVLATIAFAVVPREYFDGPLEERVVGLHGKGDQQVRSDEVKTVDLAAGTAARLRTVRADGRGQYRFDRSDEQILEGVTYLVQPLVAEDFRVVINSWWESLELGDVLATHIDKMAASLRLDVTHLGT